MPSEAEQAIRRILDARAAAVRAGNVDMMTADVAADVTTFDVVGPLRQSGAHSARQRAREWIDAYEGPPTWEDRALRVVADATVAFSHSLSHVTGRLKTGAQVDMWFRTTLGFEKRGDRWLIVHDHGSDPFDPDSGQASLDLKP